MLDVVGVCEPLTTIDGVTVVVASVEYWREQIVVRLTAELDADALAIEERFEARFEEYVRRRTAGEWPPETVIDPVARTLIDEVRIVDRAGDDHPFLGASSGGTGSELSMALRYGTGARGPIHIALPGRDVQIDVPAPHPVCGEDARPRVGTPACNDRPPPRNSDVLDERTTRIADRLVGVATPCAVLVSSTDGSVLVLSVEFWERQTVLHLTAELNHGALAADDEFARATEVWEAGDRSTSRPEHALAALTRTIQIGLAADANMRPTQGNGSLSSGIGSTWTATYRLITPEPCPELLIDGRLQATRWNAAVPVIERRPDTGT